MTGPNAQPTHLPPAREPRHLRWRWINLGAVLIVLVPFTIGMTAEMLHNVIASPRDLHEKLIAQMVDTMDVSGGAWVFGEEMIPWSREVAEKDPIGPCGAYSDGPVQYNETIYGPGVPDPAAAIKKMTKHWQSLGYTVRTVAPIGMRVPQIAVDLPHGASLGFTASTEISGIDGSSECFAEKSAPSS